jgi:hypothetical protein
MPMKTHDFLEAARRAALASLDGAAPESRVRSSMVQLYFGDPRQHYELWLRLRDRLVEIGLHFEGEREDSLARIAQVADSMPLVMEGLGPQVEVEEWTERWTRVHETVPLRVLDEAYAAELGHRLARYVKVLQPIVAGLPPMTPRSTTRGRGRWEGRRAGPKASVSPRARR